MAANRHISRLITGIIVGIITIFRAAPLTYAAEAGPIQVTALRQSDLDADGRPDVTEIDALIVTGYTKPFPNYPHDAITGALRVTVYDQAGDMQRSNDWRVATDFDDDIWLYDSGNDQHVELMIIFSNQDNHMRATLYDDCNGDGELSYRLAGKTPEITECRYPTMWVDADPTWRLADGSLNYNLNFTLDGCVDTTPVNKVSRGYRTCDERTLINGADGEPDIEVEVRDTARDGIPDYLLGRVVRTEPEMEGAAGLQVNAGEHPSREYPDQLFWPLLITDHRTERYNFFDYQPAVYVNWDRARIYAGTTGYPIEDGYFINSFTRWDKHITNDANFENPMAYYDLAADNDGQPELFIRMITYPANDPQFYFGRYDQPFVAAETSWDQNNDHTWDYKVALWGTHPLDSVAFPDFAVSTPAYAQLPTWVTEKPWNVGMFVATEKAQYITSEGIYLWDSSTGYQDGQELASPLPKYLMGFSETPPTEYYQDIEEGMRGEYTFELRTQPWLYVSPIDGRLHLRGAVEGVWNLGATTRLRYADLDGDTYLDCWRYYIADELRQALYAGQDYMLYSEADRVVLRQTRIPPVDVEILPPRNHTEWEALGTWLATQPDRDPHHLYRLLTAFPGPQLTISGATITTYRPQPDGAHLEIELQPGFRVTGTDTLGLSKLPAGRYALVLGPHPTLMPITATGVSANLVVQEPQQLVKNDVRVELQNNGQADIHDAIVELHAISATGKTTVLSQTVTLPAGDTTYTDLSWAPRSAGTWTLTALVHDSTQQITSSAAIHVDVIPAIAATPSRLLALNGGATTILLIGLSMICVALVSANAMKWGHNDERA